MIRIWIKALRPHQWLKNILVFVPLVSSHMLQSGDLLLQAGLAFALFSLCASGIYILNDICDANHDRAHPRKKDRPFAAGHLSVTSGLAAAAALILLSFCLSIWLMPVPFSVTLAVYGALTVLYSLLIKKLMIADVLTLAILYILRIVAGITAIGSDFTFWIFLFSLFIFTSLALIKRYTEIMDIRLAGQTDQVPGRGYHIADLPVIASLGITSGYLSVLVLGLYARDKETADLYTTPEYIWFACPVLLYWVSRKWLLASRGQMHDDPVIFAIMDPVSIAAGLVFGFFFWMAL